MKSSPDILWQKIEGPALPRDVEAIHDEILALEEAIEVTAAGILDVDIKARSQSWARCAPSPEALSGAVGGPYGSHLTPRSCLLLYFRERLARLNEREVHFHLLEYNGYTSGGSQ